MRSCRCGRSQPRRLGDLHAGLNGKAWGSTPRLRPRHAKSWHPSHFLSVSRAHRLETVRDRGQRGSRGRNRSKHAAGDGERER